MHKFLANNRDELIARCKAKVAQRPRRAATAQQLANGIPLFLEQLTKTLIAEEAGDLAEGERISGPAGGDGVALSLIGVTATAYGKELMALGYTVDQVVHDRAHPSLPACGIRRGREKHRIVGGDSQRLCLGRTRGGRQYRNRRKRDHLLAALVNLLQNACKSTHAHTEVRLHAYASGDRVSIDVKDHCGGLPAGFTETMFQPFTQGSFDRSGLGLGLSIALRTVEANRGSLTVRDVPGTGCVFTISLPRHSL
jgi:hypothetical protein